ncbi:Protein FecR [Halioglobus japonicus]|nr:Protein FecR [Halioglobus japonicus]
MLALQIEFENIRDAIGQNLLKRPPVPTAIVFLLLCAILFSLSGLLSTRPDIQALATGTSVSANHQTAWRQKRDIELDDGTIINLNWNTSVSVAFSPQQRHVILHYGEAQFTVSPDRARPFTVETKGVYATAIGTQFMVRKSESNEATITVSEGAVEVSSATIAAVRLKRNQQISSSATNPGEVLTVDADTLKSWQQGLLVFREHPLLEVLRELNRYTRFDIERGFISDTDRKVTGTYFADRADDALTLIALAFDLELELQGGNTVVVKSRRVKPPE